MKTFYTLYMGGKIKYTVNYYDGIKTHNDGSPFYDIAIFKNKKQLKQMERELLKTGYTKI